MSETARLMMTRCHPDIKAKSGIWSLIGQSYKGGTFYKSSNLWQHAKESDQHYKARQQRFVYINHLQPLADMVAGFLFAEKPTREIADSEVEALMESVTRKQGIEEFSHVAATHSLMMTCGVLVDSPAIPEGVRTMADQKALDLRPYAVLYIGGQICDFSIDLNGELVWVLLDTSSYENDDPTKPGVSRETRRLWTRTNWQDYEKTVHNGQAEFIETEGAEHSLGFVPFRFLNWRDSDWDGIAETPFEDIALLDQKFSNVDSYADEMLGSGTFKIFAYPGDEVPESLKASGMGPLSIVNYPAGGSPPAFIGAGLDELAPFLAYEQALEARILGKLGLDVDHDKKFVQSGVAKSLEFEKCESILRGGAWAMQAMEQWIFETMGAWMGKSPEQVDAVIEYTQQFQSEDVDMQLTRLKGAFPFFPAGEARNRWILKIVQKATRDLNREESQEILDLLEKELKKGSEIRNKEPKDLANMERQNAEQNGNELPTTSAVPESPAA